VLRKAPEEGLSSWTVHGLSNLFMNMFMNMFKFLLWIFGYFQTLQPLLNLFMNSSWTCSKKENNLDWSTGWYVRVFPSRMVQKGNLNLNWRKFRFLVRKKMCLVQVSFLQRDRRRMKKNKKVWKCSEMGIREERRREFRDSKARRSGVNYCCNWRTSLYRRVVSPTLWMLQIRAWSIVTWEFFTLFYTSWCTTGPHVGHACPSRHVNV
jgi:hypothetical protein